MIIAGALVLAFAAGIAFLSEPLAVYPLWLAWTGLGTLGWLLAWRGLRQGRTLRFAGIVLVALLVRILALVPATELSDDLYRYLWDGRVANAGIHPFAFPPNAPELAGLRDDSIWPRVNHPEIATIYPPVAQMLFRVIDRVQPTPRGVRATMAAFDFVTFLLLAALLRRRGRDPAWALVHGWCPLAVLESGASGHIDAAGATLLTAAWLSLDRGSRDNVVAGFSLGLSSLVKPIAPFVFPTLIRRASAAWLIGGAALSLLLVIPYLGVGTKLFVGFRAYADHWHFNDSIYGLLTQAGATPRGARLALAAMLVAVILIVARRVQEPLGRAGCVVGAVLVLSPTVHPWYALWLVPLLPFLPRATLAAGITFVALLPVSYYTAWREVVEGVWLEPAWMRPLLWLPVFGLLGWGLTRRFQGLADHAE